MKPDSTPKQGLPPPPFQGLRVAESAGTAGALTGRMLTDLGATVFTARSKSDGSSGRLAAFYGAFDLGKTVVRAAEFAEHALSADVILWDVNAQPGAICCTSLRADNPSAIILRFTPFGSNGPDADRPSSDLIAIAASGYLNLTGAAQGRPVKPSAPFMSARFASLHAFAALLIARRRQRKTGQGALIDVSIRDVGLWMLVNAYQFWDQQQINLTRRGNTYAIGDMSLALPLLFETSDGSVVWLPMTGRDVRGMQALVGRMAAAGFAAPDLLARDLTQIEFASQAEIEDFLQPFRSYFRSQKTTSLYDDAVIDGTLLAPVNNFSHVLDDPQLAARDNWIITKNGKDKLPKAPVQMTAVPWPARSQ
ncbi:crotonobetainyl-CoA:carnitine CoA-transferase CaiB-like acyl-CoA transferase [Yoonia maritima]|uniref:Crotonobetainyl-CoA:carnitine CoA-transferase CaiB-like acyl-CoA transferase n=1 Tax=Yoonia maritima TaxID=1435347 RepID=A0A2T0VVG5_9RHOB|nr:CoA transferase [Yoonia maritima]PRY75532.1 crotonobetainyl-CoA:carnitine CoA-transferase CaiB-like acyl-CoA transferase [Yoonia maritima]